METSRAGIREPCQLWMRGPHRSAPRESGRVGATRPTRIYERIAVRRHFKPILRAAGLPRGSQVAEFGGVAYPINLFPQLTKSNRSEYRADPVPTLVTGFSKAFAHPCLLMGVMWFATSPKFSANLPNSPKIVCLE